MGPAAAELVRLKSLAHPGGNITGGTFEASPLIYGKTLEDGTRQLGRKA